MKRLFFALFLAGCSTTYVDHGSYVAEIAHHGGQDPRVRYLVLHYTAIDEQKSLTVLTGKSVSAHYLVPAEQPAKPFVYQLVPENLRSWHAGISHWQRASDLNDSSIGIEIVNLGPLDPEKKTWQSFNDAQIKAVIALARDIVGRYHIPPNRIVAHADIAPQRKEDPGPLFPWERLAHEGLGAWPDASAVAAHLAGHDPKEPVNLCVLESKLAGYGYDTAIDGVPDDKSKRVLQAFQMHFRPRDYAGDADAETDAIVSALLEKYVPNVQLTPCAAPPATAALDGGTDASP